MRTSERFVARAAECERLAGLTDDEMIRAELLALKDTYLAVAERLAWLEQGEKKEEPKG